VVVYATTFSKMEELGKTAGKHFRDVLSYAMRRYDQEINRLLQIKLMTRFFPQIPHDFLMKDRIESEK
jgi:hypothetical protein